jgi:ribonucleoside-diphosphate reductase alpha chain
MFLLLSGCGVGYSVQTHHVEQLPEIRKPLKSKRYLVGDSIEGWADAVRMLTKAYFGYTTTAPLFDFRDIRPKGASLITVGG